MVGVIPRIRTLYVYICSWSVRLNSIELSVSAAGERSQVVSAETKCVLIYGKLVFIAVRGNRGRSSFSEQGDDQREEIQRNHEV
jgi:hypothetical protein